MKIYVLKYYLIVQESLHEVVAKEKGQHKKTQGVTSTLTTKNLYLYPYGLALKREA